MPRFAPLLPRTLLPGLLLAASAWSAVAGEPERYRLDPVHTRVLFKIEHAGFSEAMGTVSGSTGTLLFDRDDWRSAQLEVSVPLQRLDLGDDKWNAAALAGNLLDGKRYPQARFVSTAVEPVDADHAKVCGDLTLHGVTRPLCLNVTLNALKRHPLPPFRRTAGFSACATLSRAEFGIDAWKNVIGDRVELRIEAEAVRSNGDQAAPDEAQPQQNAEPAGEPSAPARDSNSISTEETPPDPTP